jgi:hypothetical protein
MGNNELETGGSLESRESKAEFGAQLLSKNMQRAYDCLRIRQSIRGLSGMDKNIADERSRGNTSSMSGRAG